MSKKKRPGGGFRTAPRTTQGLPASTEEYEALVRKAVEGGAEVPFWCPSCGSQFPYRGPDMAAVQRANERLAHDLRDAKQALVRIMEQDDQERGGYGPEWHIAREALQRVQ